MYVSIAKISRLLDASAASEEAVDEKIKWMESNADAEVEDLKAQKKELEEIVQPIMTKLYQGAGGAPPPSGEEGADEKDEL